jgi:O-antigen/teichoic acid export membrane protein
MQEDLAQARGIKLKRIVAENFLIIGASKLISLLITLYFAKLLTVEDYGLYSKININIMYLSLLHLGSMNGIGIELPKYLNRYLPQRSTKFYISYFIFSFALQAVIGLVVFIMFKGVSWPLLVLVFLYFVFLKSSDNIKIYYLSSLKLEKNNVFRLFSEILAPLIALGLLFYTRNITGIFAGFSIAYGGIFLFSVFFLWYQIRRFGYNFNHFYLFIKRLYITGFPIYIVWMLDMQFQYFSTFLMSHFYSVTDLANYYFASNFVGVLPLAAYSIMSPYGQLVYKNIALKENLKAHEYLRKGTKYILLLCIVIAVLLIVGYPVVSNYVGKYSENYVLMLSMLPANFIIALTGLMVYFITAIYRARTLIKFQLIAFSIGLLLNFVVVWFHLDLIWFVISGFIALAIYFAQLLNFIHKDRKKLKLLSS